MLWEKGRMRITEIFVGQVIGLNSKAKFFDITVGTSSKGSHMVRNVRNQKGKKGHGLGPWPEDWPLCRIIEDGASTTLKVVGAETGQQCRAGRQMQVGRGTGW